MIKLLLVWLYLRFLHAFDIEVWRDVEGYEGLYKVSNTGKILSLHTGKILKPFSKKGYQYVNLYRTGDGKKKDFTIHRLVCLAFLPNPKNLPDVNHKDETRDNNDVLNLEWCTVAYNNNYGTRVERCTNTRRTNLYGTTDEETIERIRVEKEREYRIKYYEANKEKIKESYKEYRKAHLDEVKAYKKQYNKEHREECNDYMRSYYSKNRNKILEQRKKT